MNAKTLLLLAGVALGELATAETMLKHVPLVMWSRRPTFQSIESYASAALDEAAVVSTLTRALASSQSSSASTAELLAVFLPTKLHTEDVAKFTAVDATDSFVQRAVGDAKSAVVIPHTTRAASLVSALADNSVAYNEVPIEELEAFLSTSKGQALVTNGKADLLVVRISAETYSLPATDALIQAASEVLASATKQSVDFALTGDKADAKQIPTLLGARRRRLAASPAANKTAAAAGAIVCETGFYVGHSGGKAFCFSHYVHMTPEVLTGLLFGFFFIFLAYVGISALNAIQTPTRYPHHGPPRGKEF